MSLPTFTQTNATEHSLPAPGITRELARERAAQISELRYQIALQLVPKAPRYQGKLTLTFELRHTRQPVVLDFRDVSAQGELREGTIRKVRVNEFAVAEPQQHNGHLILPATLCRMGENVVTLEFETSAAAAGRPLIRYEDKDDGSEYVYTLFVPMDASLAFPCFDQPDLKGRFSLQLQLPDGWTAIGNTPVLVQNGDHIGFAETEPISTYLFAFAAGPFERIAVKEPAQVPLNFYVRRTKRAQAEKELAEVTRETIAGMQHFIRFFGHRFPFAKYDQVLLPGFAYGGMEHAGATFLREDAILFRSTPTAADKLGRASLVLHELAHQWFGDLVTMRWFDDLWLKEGFANYMASHALASMYDANAMWKRFYQVHKPQAYGIDSTPGTTPIYQEVKNLKDAKSAYGAIVYQKAPSLLRSLSFVIGERAFQKGVQLFLRQHAYGNAEWSDLIHAFETAAAKPLAAWADAWIKQRGMPQIETIWEPDARGRLQQFALQQKDVLNEGKRWPLNLNLLLIDESGKTQSVPVQFADERKEIKLPRARRAPAAMFANGGDYGYGRFLLDARSRTAVLKLMPTVHDPLLKTMLWGALWDAVREAELAPTEFIELALRALPDESDELFANSLLNQMTRAYQRYLTDQQRLALREQFEQLCAERMQQATELGLRVTYFRTFNQIASSDKARQQLKELLNGQRNVPGLELKPLDRWRIITALLVQQDEQATALLATERTRDTSDDGRKQAYLAAAAQAAAANKQRYFEDYTTNRTLPEDWIEASLGTFNAWNQAELTRPYLTQALAALPQIKRERKIFFVLAWLNAFIGGQHSAQALAEVQAFLRANQLERDLELKVLEVLNELERTVKIRGKFAEG